MKLRKLAESDWGMAAARVSVEVEGRQVAVGLQRQLRGADDKRFVSNEFHGRFSLEVGQNSHGDCIRYERNLFGVSAAYAMKALSEFVKENLAFSMQRPELAEFLASSAWGEHLDALLAESM